MKATTQEAVHAGIRKAAILVACLDRAAADAVLEQLSPEQAQRMRQAVVVLDEIPPGEQRERCGRVLPARPANIGSRTGGSGIRRPIGPRDRPETLPG